MFSVDNLPDLAIVRIFEYLPKLSDQTRVERVCRRWRQVGKSLWKRLKMIDGDQIGGGFMKYDEFKGESDYDWEEVFDLSSTLPRKYLKISQSGIAILERIDQMEIANQISRICFQKGAILTFDFLNQLLARCQYVCAIIVEDVWVVQQIIQNVEVDENEFCEMCKFDFVISPLEFPFSAYFETHLNVFSLISNFYNLSQPHIYEYLSHASNLISLGLDSIRDLQTENSILSCSKIISNNFHSLRALRLSYSSDLIRHLLKKFARDQQPLVGIQWLRIDECAVVPNYLRQLLGLVPKVKHLILNEYITDEFTQQIGFVLGQSDQIIHLQTLALMVDLGTFDPVFLLSFLSEVFCRRNASLEPMRLILFAFGVVFDYESLTDLKSVFVPFVGNQTDVEFVRANVECESLHPRDWPSIADLDFSKDF